MKIWEDIYLQKNDWQCLAAIIVTCCLTACSGTDQNKEQDTSKPNIIIIYIDDLGYGDVGCYGATAVKTPNVDFLSKNGVRFTDAHCGASTCTPSRFSLLTGIYAFRNDAAVLPGDAPLLIHESVETMPAMLHKAGYKTAIVGKWHLGLGNGTIDWNGYIGPGPNERGFDYSYIIPATTDRVPTVYVENGKVPNLDPNDPIAVSYVSIIGDEPTGIDHPEMLKMGADKQHSNTIVNGISRIGYMTGGKTARWKDEDIADILTEKARTFIGDNKDGPFFLFFSVPDIHVPRAPNERFVGSTMMGRRGDVIAEMDWMTGEITKTIEELGLMNNTLIIFTSDNGPVLDDGYADMAEELVGDHDPSGGYRGGKYSAFEAGTRVPTIAYWPTVIKPGVSDALLTQVDFMASFAALTGQTTNNKTTNDSKNMLDVILGKSQQGRSAMLEESYTLSIRTNEWKYIAPQEKQTPAWLANKKIENGLSASPQLYHINEDKKERQNIAAEHPAIADSLQQVLNDIRSNTSIQNK